MNTIKRKYQPGDEANINKLYKLITGIDRGTKEYYWEWIDTWNGKGSIWLAFDEDRENGDQLIMQYSLISTPFSFWGKPYLAGKTENCMCHPEHRGRGQFFQHEKESFEEAKRQFDLFFTTAGNAAGGTVGAIRRKLGYVALDGWVQYFFLTDFKYVREKIYSVLSQRLKLVTGHLEFVPRLATSVVMAYFRQRGSKCNGYEARVFDKSDSPLEDIETLWRRNKKLYGISVDRHRSYMQWRIDRNPYFKHRYLGLFDNGKMVGYVVFYRDKHNIMRVVDILADDKSVAIFCQLFSHLIALATHEKATAVTCSTLAGNEVLRNSLRKSRFFCRDLLSHIRNWRKTKEMPFHVYVEAISSEFQGALERGNWYITELVMEGRR